MNVDTVPRTLAVAVFVALVCSTIVSTAVYVLRPMQQGYELVERNRTIVDAAGLLPGDGLTDREIVERFLDLEAHVVELATGAYVPELDGHTFDHWRSVAAEGDPDTTADGANRVPVYILRSDGQLDRIVLPVHGPGMWSTIYGYIALDGDLVTVRDIVFFQHGETPGVGDRIEDPDWRDEWQGKRIYGDDGNVRLRVMKGASSEFEVDLISGASVTCEAVGSIVGDWFSSDGYRPLLDRLQQEEQP